MHLLARIKSHTVYVLVFIVVAVAIDDCNKSEQNKTFDKFPNAKLKRRTDCCTFRMIAQCNKRMQQVQQSQTYTRSIRS